MIARLDPVAADLLRETPLANVRPDLLRLSNLEPALQRGIAKEIQRGAKNIRTALQTLRLRKVRAKGTTPKRGKHYALVVGDFADLPRHVEDGTAALVVADLVFELKRWVVLVPTFE